MATRVVNHLPQFIESVERRGARAMTSALVLGASEAAALTPIDTSTLLNSQYRDVQQEGHRVVGRVGYTADYAAPVHDPGHPQTFRRAGAEKSFLSKGMERAEPAIRQVLTQGIKA